MSPTKPKRSGNRLLDRLPKEVSRRLHHLGEKISLPNGYEVSREGGPISHVYFPHSGAICLMILMEDGTAIDAASIGNEGMIGMPICLGLDFSPVTVIAQVSGDSLRIPTAEFLQVMRSGPALEKLVHRYVAYLLRYANQTVACNLLHSVQERMCRWLLTAQDRADSDELLVTHEFLADMLGVRRQTASVVAGTLQTAGLVSYRRGVLRISDRAGLQAACCECYTVTKTLYNRIMQ